jgi:hypothetical protein
MTLCLLSSAPITALYSLKISRGKGRTQAGHFCAFSNFWWNYFPGRLLSFEAIEGERAGKTKAQPMLTAIISGDLKCSQCGKRCWFQKGKRLSTGFALSRDRERDLDVEPLTTPRRFG